MLFQNEGETFVAENRRFTIGGEVFANGNSEYMGLFGTVTEIRTGSDRETENDTPDIHCAFVPPESPGMVSDMEQRFSDLYRCPKKIGELALDYAIMAPEMLEPIPASLPASPGKTYSLTYYRDDDDSCGVGTLAISSDIGMLLRKMLEDLGSYEKDVVLSHAEQTVGGLRFSYEARNTGVEGLYLGYTISETPVLPAAMETMVYPPLWDGE